MAIIDLDVFMVNLKRLIYDNSNELIGSNRFIKAKMSKIELLHNEFDYLIGSGLNDINVDEKQLHEVEDAESWKRRLMEAAVKAENVVDLFISSAILKENEFLKGEGHAAVFTCSLNLKDVLKDLKSIRKDMRRKIRKFWMFSNKRSVNNNNIQHLTESQRVNTQVAETSSGKNTAGLNPSGTEKEQVIVGLDDDAVSILDRLTGDRKQLDIISIVGMGGIGKTTLATKIYNDEYVEYYFDVRGWISVSETYATRDLLIGILASIGKSVDEGTTEGKLSEMVYRSVKGRKYLIVIDDIWSAKAWDDLRLYFPDDNTGSRLLLTTRLAEVAAHASRGGFTHNQQCLTEEKSWELLHRKIFRGYECPENLIETGKHIAKKCQGLPLALVVIAGILGKGEESKDMWEKVAENVSSYIVDDPKGCLDTLALSYDHLPRHLRNCFLYVGGFPEDHEIQVRRLILLWIAEGFIKGAPQRSLEEQAEDYLMELVDRNLLIVVNRRSDGGIKSCRLHDLLRELCLIKAAEEKFFKKIGMSDGYIFHDSTTYSIEKQQRLLTDYKVVGEISSHHSTTHIRSILCFSNSEHLGTRTGKWVPSFRLLKVLDLLNISRADLRDIQMLIHLRYLAVWSAEQEFPFSISSLWSLQTLILKGKFLDFMYSPDNMSNMVSLRHLWSERIISIHSTSLVLFNLQTMSRLRLGNGDQTLLQSFPNIKKLACSVSVTSVYQEFFNFSILTHLETLDVENCMDGPLHIANPFMFPKTLKKLTLKRLLLPWAYISTIQQLPKLEVLKLLDYSFVESRWDTGNEQFCQLKFLKLQRLDLVLWEASSFNFPQLRRLEVGNCNNLKKIPIEIGNISTLEHIEIADGTSALIKSVNKIQEEQRAMGNYDIHVKFVGSPLPHEVFFGGNPYYA